VPDDARLQRRLAAIERTELSDLASRIAGFDLGKRPTFAAAGNVSGLRTRALTFSCRRDSRTIFATDTRYGYLGTGGTWKGPDRQAISACRRVLRAAGIPAGEIGATRVVLEFGAVGERVSDKEVRVCEPELLRKVAHAQRVIDGMPVWSSHALVGLTQKGQIGYLELHWPSLPPEVVKEAHVLHALVQHGFEPAGLPEARVESIDAGIIHSPAIGFFMDVTAAIRVVYVGDDPRVGRKPTLYLDRHGQRVALPRDLRAPKPEPIARNPA
jgi:hypothetical protein